jgi:hypothetical protein
MNITKEQRWHKTHSTTYESKYLKSEMQKKTLSCNYVDQVVTAPRVSGMLVVRNFAL